jgi:hypothetical protein
LGRFCKSLKTCENHKINWFASRFQVVDKDKDRTARFTKMASLSGEMKMHLVAKHVATHMMEIVKGAQSCGFVTRSSPKVLVLRDVLDLVILANMLCDWSVEAGPGGEATVDPSLKVKSFIFNYARNVLVTSLSMCSCPACNAMANLVANKHNWHDLTQPWLAGANMAMREAVIGQAIYCLARSGPATQDAVLVMDSHLQKVRRSRAVIGAYILQRSAAMARWKKARLDAMAKAFDEIDALEGEAHERFCALAAA